METMADLVECFQLYAVCTECGRMEQVSIQPLIQHHGPQLTIESVRRRLRCRECAQRTGDIRIVYVGESEKVSGFHYRGNPQPVAQPVRSSVDSSVKPNPSTPT